MEEKTYKPKLRITTLEDNGSYIQDRLVDAYTEMNSGPKVQHKGPIRIEVTLTNKQDVENFKNYDHFPQAIIDAGPGVPSYKVKKNKL